MMVARTRSMQAEHAAFESGRRQAGASRLQGLSAQLLVLIVVVIAVLLLSQEDLRLGWRCR